MKHVYLVAKEAVGTILASFVENKLHSYLKSSLQFSYNSLVRFLTVAMAYLDLCFDSILVGTILIVLGHTITQYNLFSTQLAILLLASILVPSFATANKIARSRPLIAVGLDEWVRRNEHKKYKIVILQFILHCKCLLVPAMIIRSEEKATERQKVLKDRIVKMAKDKNVQDSDLEEVEQINAFLNECRLGMLTFRINELCLELVIQLSVHLTMVLLSQTNFPIESGLQSIFKSNDNDEEEQGDNSKQENLSNKSATLAFLIISILWSFKTSALTSIKIATESKKFLPIAAKLIVGMRYLLIFVIRICSFVTYFAPYLGTLDIMAHYQAETVILEIETFKRLNKTGFYFINTINNEIQSVPISKIFRADYNNTHPELSQPPPTTVYTLITLKTASIWFCVIFVLYSVILVLIKNSLNASFKSASFWKKLTHILQAIIMPNAYGDWDSDSSLSLEDHNKMWKKTLWEMMVMIGLQLLTNLIFLLPFTIMALNVRNRHELLLSALGYVFPEEEHAYWLVNLLIWILPTTISIAAVVDMLFAVIYMKFAHPWKGLLAKDEKKEKSDHVEVSESAQSQEDPEVANGVESREVQEVSETAQI